MSSIEFFEPGSQFFLHTSTTSYVMMVHKGAYLMHVYWGGRIETSDIGWHCEPPYRRRERIAEAEPGSSSYTSEFWPFEYPAFGTSDFRPPALQVEDSCGYRLTDLTYDSHEIFRGKPPIAGLPSIGESALDAHTLEIVLKDRQLSLEVSLFYSVFDGSDVICRHSVIRNFSKTRLILHKALSASVDMKNGELEMLQLSGTTLRERRVHRRLLEPGTSEITSTRGISSHIHNPCTVYLRPGADDFSGEVYALNLMYSGNFASGAHVDQYGSARIGIGINPLTFSWTLEPDDEFSTPEAFLVYSSKGINGISRQFHDVLNNRLPNLPSRNRQRAIALNTWEACYFDVSHDRVALLAEHAGRLGIELLVLDDGWFGERNDETTSLGDWKVNRQKFPGGLSGIAEAVRARGLQFGIWMEPEMVSPGSRLYRAHPDWVLHVPGRTRSEWRYQLVLDLSRDEVCEYIIDTVSEVLSSAPIDYVKWDMNRRLTEVGNEIAEPYRQMEISHRYILGMYRIMQTLSVRFPDVCFENCASGGGRYDAGMLYYFPHAWPSDNTDASSRLSILSGSSVGYPLSNFRSHVTSSPNHQMMRQRSLEFRLHVASCGVFGYELDLTSLSSEEEAMVKRHNTWYKAYRNVVLGGDFYRLLDPQTGNKASFCVVAADRTTAIVWYFRYLADAEEAYFTMKLAGLDPGRMYQCLETGLKYSGAVIMNVGLPVPWVGTDDLSVRWTFEAVDD